MLAPWLVQLFRKSGLATRAESLRKTVELETACSALSKVALHHASVIRSIKSSPTPDECVLVNFDFSNMACRLPCFRALVLCLLLKFAEETLWVSCLAACIALRFALVG